MPSAADLTLAVNFAIRMSKPENNYRYKVYPNYNWVTPDHKMADTNYFHGCHGTLTYMKTPQVYINRFQYVEKHEALAHRFYDFLIGSESPFIQWSDELFPDTEVNVSCKLPDGKDGVVNINSLDFRLKYAHVVTQFEVTPAQVFISFFKMMRVPIEYPESLVIWGHLIDDGIEPRAALAYAMYFNGAIKDGIITPQMHAVTFHSWLDGYQPEKTIKTLHTRKFHLNHVKKAFQFNSDWYSTDLIWHGKVTQSSSSESDTTRAWRNKIIHNCERVAKKYIDPFTDKEVQVPNAPIIFSSFINAVKQDFERIVK